MTVDKLDGMDDTERQSLLDSIDYNRLSETALQTALDSKLVPAAFIAKAALNLCASLRADLEAANAVIGRKKTDAVSRSSQDTRMRALSAHNGLGTSFDASQRSKNAFVSRFTNN